MLPLRAGQMPRMREAGELPEAGGLARRPSGRRAVREGALRQLAHDISLSALSASAASCSSTRSNCSHNPYGLAWLGSAPSGRWVLDRGRPKCIMDISAAAEDAVVPYSGDLAPLQPLFTMTPRSPSPDLYDREVPAALVELPTQLPNQLLRQASSGSKSVGSEAAGTASVFDSEGGPHSPKARACMLALSCCPEAMRTTRTERKKRNKTVNISERATRFAQVLDDADKDRKVEELSEILADFEDPPTQGHRGGGAAATKRPTSMQAQAGSAMAAANGFTPPRLCTEQLSLWGAKLKKVGLGFQARKTLVESAEMSRFKESVSVATEAAMKRARRNSTQLTAAAIVSTMTSLGRQRPRMATMVPTRSQQRKSKDETSDLASQASSFDDSDGAEVESTKSCYGRRGSAAAAITVAAMKLKSVKRTPTKTVEVKAQARAEDGSRIDMIQRQQSHRRITKMKTEARRLRESLMTSARQAFKDEVFEACGVESDHLRRNKPSFVDSLGAAFKSFDSTKAKDFESAEEGDGRVTRSNSRGSLAAARKAAALQREDSSQTLASSNNSRPPSAVSRRPSLAVPQR
eukprot:TRINITY_DN22417_c0_g1_i2.p1 TRINITY_DN22417_c0_g1~~TRINITY_DN22417_c0_g1_i2.p1  ORF type:complete len:578 (-),score=126.52 TRINITY_DN22417_c0_g1_i2:214-1947(-)